MRIRILALSLALTAAAFAPALAGTIKQLTHQPPNGAIVTMQMTDGTVVAQDYTENGFWKLAPDTAGSCGRGAGTHIENPRGRSAPYAKAESVLPGGRFVFAGAKNNHPTFAFTNKSRRKTPLLTSGPPS